VVGGTGTGAITLGAATLADGVSLTVGTGINNAITMGAVSGVAGGAASNLTLNSTGAVNAGTIGTDIGTLTLIGTGLTAAGSVTAANTNVSGTSSISSGANAQNLGSVALADGTALTLTTTGAGTIATGTITGVAGGAASDITFNSGGAVAVGGALGTDIGTVTVANSGGVTFQGTVDAATIAIADTAASATVAFQGNTNATTGMTVGAGTGAYNVSLTGTSNTIAGATTFNNTGTTTIGDAVGDTTNFTGGVSVTGAGGAILGGTITASNSAFSVTGNTTLGAATTVSTGGGDVTFTGLVDGAQSLTVNSAGTTLFSAAVGSGTPLTSLTTDAGGTTAINGGSIITSGAQTYNDAVTLGAATTLTGVGVSFASTLNGAQTLSIIDSGTTTFGGAVGGGTALTSLTTDAGGTTAINGGSVKTSGAQIYNDAVSAGTVTLTTTGGGNITAVNAGNDFGNLSLSGTDAMIRDANSVSLGTSTLTGYLDLVSGGSITQGGVLSIGGGLWAMATGDIFLKSLNVLGASASLTAGAANQVWLNATRIEVGTVRPSDLTTTNVGITAANVTLEAPSGSAFITNGTEGLVTATAPLSATAALTIRTLPSNGAIGDSAAPTTKGLRVQTSGLVQVFGDGIGDGTIFLIGDDAVQPKYEFSGDPLHRIVKYNGVDATNAQLTGALDAAYLDIRNQTTEIRESGFAKENASKVLRRGVVTSAGPGQPAVDDSTGLAGLEQCDGTFGGGRLACQ
jgi:hypothetical protein